ncbi:dnaJ homolog subfamily C member 8-like [Vulpes vulpes]|uniref:DnaJ homolog subfamily C member 8 n=1 Tax=Vulpes vulpes TaxID=9627 RepID=A0A3Q7UW06_VULVU|nr:dnaJ homolog subfamily C member 8-like [Vulpes vulpes]
MGALSKKHLFSTVQSVGVKVKVPADQDLVRPPAPRFPDGWLLVAPSHRGQRSKLSPASSQPVCILRPVRILRGTAEREPPRRPAAGCTPAGPPQGPVPLEAGPAPPPLWGSVRGTAGLRTKATRPRPLVYSLASDLCAVIRCTPRKLGQQSRVLRSAHLILLEEIEKIDSVLTSKNQIERLTRPGSSYFNLNPFEVLQIDPEVTDEEIKKRFRQLSILVHPDKNQDDADRAQKAFEAVDKAYKLLLDQEQKKRALDVIQAGKEYVEHTVKERKKQLKKEGKPTNVEEDDPELFKQAVYKQTMKLFAELEIKRKEREAKEMHERKRQREEEIEAQEKAKREREWQKNFEESRDGRVDSWRNFQANTKGKKEKKNRTFLRPPKVKMEQRE